MKRILHWTDGFAPSIGGTEVFILELARAQLRAGHDVHVVAESIGGCADTTVHDGVAVQRFPFTRTLLAKNAAAVRDLTRRLGRFRAEQAVDQLHVHFNGVAAWFELLSRPPGPAPVLTVHAPPDSLRVPEPLRRRILRSAGTVVAVSRAHGAALVRFDPRLAPAVTVVLNGCAEPPQAPEPVVTDRADVFRFAFLGRLVDSKGVSIALRALARVQTAHRGGCRLAIAGDGPARAALEAEAEALGLTAEHVAFAGWIAPEASHAWLRQADVVLVPSTWEEPFGLVAVQAALAGRPVIASRVGALAEIVVDGVTGWLVPGADPDALATRMLACIDAPDRGRGLGVRALDHARATFTIDRCRADYDRLYRSPSPPSPPAPHANPLLV